MYVPILESLHAFAISLVIGLLIGLEREHSHPKGIKAMGVRTFVLFALLGTLAAKLDDPALAISISAFVFAIIILGYLRTTTLTLKYPDMGITTEVSAGIVFCLGFIVLHAPLVASILGAIVLLVLLERRRLHKFARKKLMPHEIEAAVILFIFMLGVLPSLPDRTIDPWNLFNPRNFGILMTMIAVIQFGGYLSIRLFGDRLGMAVTGILGGFISSTAVFTTLPKMLRDHPKLPHSV